MESEQGEGDTCSLRSFTKGPTPHPTRSPGADRAGPGCRLLWALSLAGTCPQLCSGAQKTPGLQLCRESGLGDAGSVPDATTGTTQAPLSRARGRSGRAEQSPSPFPRGSSRTGSVHIISVGGEVLGGLWKSGARPLPSDPHTRISSCLSGQGDQGGEGAQTPHGSSSP